MEQSIKNMLDETENQDLSYVTNTDIQNCFKGSQLLVLEAPLGAELSVAVATGTKVTITNCP